MPEHAIHTFQIIGAFILWAALVFTVARLWKIRVSRARQHLITKGVFRPPVKDTVDVDGTITHISGSPKFLATMKAKGLKVGGPSTVKAE